MTAFHLKFICNIRIVQKKDMFGILGNLMLTTLINQE